MNVVVQRITLYVPIILETYSQTELLIRFKIVKETVANEVVVLKSLLYYILYSLENTYLKIIKPTYPQPNCQTNMNIKISRLLNCL